MVYHPGSCSSDVLQEGLPPQVTRARGWRSLGGGDPGRVRRRRDVDAARANGRRSGPRFGTLDNPVTLQTFDDNPPIDSNLEPEAGPLVIYNWEQYIWKKMLTEFGKKYNVEVKYETFYNMEQAIQKFQTGEVDYDVFFRRSTICPSSRPRS